jgi:hypothetical protein
MDKEPLGPTPSANRREVASAVVRAGVGLTPFVARPLAELQPGSEVMGVVAVVTKEAGAITPDDE